MDVFTSEKRSEIMRRIRGKDTKPEKIVRSLLHRLGFRFRLHRKDLPGKPDIVLPKYRTIIFVHGCFWHRHAGCAHATTPASRPDYWLPKFQRTIERDRENRTALRRAGWTVIVVWECELRDREALTRRLKERICRPAIEYSETDAEFASAAETGGEYAESAQSVVENDA